MQLDREPRKEAEGYPVWMASFAFARPTLYPSAELTRVSIRRAGSLH